MKEVGQLRTFTPQPVDINRRWLVIDAEGAMLGRMSTEIATLLRGKHKPIWAPHVDMGDHVIVVNASKLAISHEEGDRQALPPPLRVTRAASAPRASSTSLARDPERVVRLAVRRMLPKGPLGRQMLKKLKVYGGPTHPHSAQQPVAHALPARSPRAAPTA